MSSHKMDTLKNKVAAYTEKYFGKPCNVYERLCKSCVAWDSFTFLFEDYYEFVNQEKKECVDK